MQIPNKIKIGALTYKVKVVDNMKDAAGEYNGAKQVLAIGKATADSMKVTLLHEIIHAINSEINEVTTEFIAQALYQLIKENPKMFQGGELNGFNK